MNVSMSHSVAATRRYERCTEKLSVYGPINATLWVLQIRGSALRILLIYVPSMFCMKFVPEKLMGAEIFVVPASEHLVNRKTEECTV